MSQKKSHISSQPRAQTLLFYNESFIFVGRYYCTSLRILITSSGRPLLQQYKRRNSLRTPLILQQVIKQNASHLNQ